MTSRCHRCDRHLLDDPVRCPFCRSMQRVAGIPPVLCALIGLGLVGCTDRATDDTSDGMDAGGSENAGTTGDDGTTSTVSSATATSGMTTVDTPTAAMTTTATGDTTTGSDSTTTDTTSTTDFTNGEVSVLPYAGAYPDAESEGTISDTD